MEKPNDVSDILIVGCNDDHGRAVIYSSSWCKYSYINMNKMTTTSTTEPFEQSIIL